ncbi:unnamed protein product [Gadus morhua 'NCC']
MKEKRLTQWYWRVTVLVSIWGEEDIITSVPSGGGRQRRLPGPAAVSDQLTRCSTGGLRTEKSPTALTVRERVRYPERVLRKP